MSMNEFQKTANESYGDDLIADYATNSASWTYRGDSLAAHIALSLSTSEECDSREVAISRLLQSIRDLMRVLVAFSPSACDDLFDAHDFLSFYRDDERLNTLSVDDRLEVFSGILLGSSDITKELLDGLLADYNGGSDKEDLIIVDAKKQSS